jgi:hypothetical protein
MFKPGQIVKFAVPMTEAERLERFTVLEMRGERVLVQDASSFWDGHLLHPTAVYLAADLIAA